CFASHLDKVQKFTPENWTRENLPEKLERATMVIDIALDEYEQAALHFQGSRSGAIFGQPGKRKRNAASDQSSEFVCQLRNGLAFNLPVILLGLAGLVVYLLK
ncbi:MAG: hypothetical protein ACO3RV_06080, partial [Luteolibacter sp.]